MFGSVYFVNLLQLLKYQVPELILLTLSECRTGFDIFAFDSSFLNVI